MSAVKEEIERRYGGKSARCDMFALRGSVSWRPAAIELKIERRSLRSRPGRVVTKMTVSGAKSDYTVLT